MWKRGNMWSRAILIDRKAYFFFKSTLKKVVRWLSSVILKWISYSLQGGELINTINSALTNNCMKHRAKKRLIILNPTFCFECHTSIHYTNLDKSMSAEADVDSIYDFVGGYSEEGIYAPSLQPSTTILLVVIAKRVRPIPSRTRKLSSSAPMVLPGKPGGRVGRRQHSF